MEVCQLRKVINRSHGESMGKGRPGTKEYRAWLGMIKRCTNPNHPSAATYAGQRNINEHDAARQEGPGRHCREG
jgi:hypothetical protein